MANEHKDRYLRFKADEASQALTGAYRQAHPEDNLERQAIHEHVSAVRVKSQYSNRTAAGKEMASTTGAGG